MYDFQCLVHLRGEQIPPTEYERGPAMYARPRTPLSNAM